MVIHCPKPPPYQTFIIIGVCTAQSTIFLALTTKSPQISPLIMQMTFSLLKPEISIKYSLKSVNLLHLIPQHRHSR